MSVDTPPHSRPRARRIPIRTRSGLARLVSSVGRLASIQLQLAIAQLKLSAQRFFLAAALFVMAGALVILGMVFLHIGVFQILEQYLRPQWVWLIFTGTDALLATALFLAARSLLSKPLIEPDQNPAEAYTRQEKP